MKLALTVIALLAALAQPSHARTPGFATASCGARVISGYRPGGRGGQHYASARVYRAVYYSRHWRHWRRSWWS